MQTEIGAAVVVGVLVVVVEVEVGRGRVPPMIVQLPQLLIVMRKSQIFLLVTAGSISGPIEDLVGTGGHGLADDILGPRGRRPVVVVDPAVGVQRRGRLRNRLNFELAVKSRSDVVEAEIPRILLMMMCGLRLRLLRPLEVATVSRGRGGAFVVVAVAAFDGRAGDAVGENSTFGFAFPFEFDEAANLEAARRFQKAVEVFLRTRDLASIHVH